jgi:two-component system chemotaxis response regulator CheB
MQHPLDAAADTADPKLLYCRGCNEKLALDRATSALTPPLQGPLRVLIVDDARLIRAAVRHIFEADARFVVVGEAGNGREALELIPTVQPDVITLDVNMPEMDGLSTLKHIMIKHPTPTVMLSALTQEGARESFEALKLGAVDFMPKPSRLAETDLDAQHQAIRRKVRQAAGVRLDALRRLRTRPAARAAHSSAGPPERCVVLGASEGGYRALLKIVPQLQPDWPAAYLAVIHAEAAHVAAFADYLDAHSALAVRPAADGLPLAGGSCYLAAGGDYVTLETQDDTSVLRVHPTPFPERRGSINMLMFSLSESWSRRAIGVILSGRDQDGAEGAAELARVGGQVIIQDPQTCLFRDMPLAAMGQCPAGCVAADADIAAAIQTLLKPTIQSEGENHV